MAGIDIPSGLHLAMIFLYLVLGQVSFLQLSRLIYHKHPLLSFQAFFLLISLVWCGERAFTFIFSPLLPPAQITFLWILPSAFQAISFSLLVLYSRFLLNQHRWSKDRFVSLVAYFALNGLLLFITILLGRLIAWPLNQTESYIKRLEMTHTVIFSLYFTLILGLYGYYTYHLNATSSSAMGARHHQHSTMSSQFWISLIALCVFLSQWLYYVLASINSAEFKLRADAGSDNILDIQWSVFLVLIVWEIVPTALILFVSRYIPASERTLLTEIKLHGFFTAVFCCPASRLGPSSMYEGLGTAHSLIDPNSPEINLLFQSPMDPNGTDGGTNLSIFGPDSNVYPHQASYEVLNEGDEHHHHHHHHHHPSGDDEGSQGEYGYGNGLGMDNQTYNLHLSAHMSLHSHPDGSEVTNGDLRGLSTTSTRTGNVSLKPSQQQQQQQHQHQHQQHNNNNGNLASASQPRSKPTKQQHSHQLPNHSDLIQLQMKSQLNQHLASYNNNDDGGDLF